LGVAPLTECWSRANASGPAALVALGLPVGNTAFNPGSEDLASVAAQLVVTCATSAADAYAALSLGRTAAGCTGAPGAAVSAPPEGLVAPPGSTLSVEIAVQDWAGNRVVAGYDANMVLQVSPLARVWEHLIQGSGNGCGWGGGGQRGCCSGAVGLAACM
jgi:hypothetical protein